MHFSPSAEVSYFVSHFTTITAGTDVVKWQNAYECAIVAGYCHCVCCHCDCIAW